MKKILIAMMLVFAAVSFAASDAGAYSVGEKAQVLWKGTWYAATVKKVNAAQNQFFIHYTGYGNDWDEWVGTDRIRSVSSSASAPETAVTNFSVSDPVSVLWKGTWYPAHVLTVLGGDRYRIHYDGYDSSWDENVGPSRIRSR